MANPSIVIVLSISLCIVVSSISLCEVVMEMPKLKYLSAKKRNLSGNFPGFSASGSIKGMKDKFYGKDALLVRQGKYIYNVSSEPYIYYHEAH